MREEIKSGLQAVYELDNRIRMLKAAIEPLKQSFEIIQSHSVETCHCCQLNKQTAKQALELLSAIKEYPTSS